MLNKKMSRQKKYCFLCDERNYTMYYLTNSGDLLKKKENSNDLIFGTRTLGACIVLEILMLCSGICMAFVSLSSLNGAWNKNDAG